MDRSNHEELNRAVHALLRESGDSAGKPRRIDHFAYFPTRAGQTLFVDACRAAGFKLRATHDPNEVSDKYCAIVSLVDVPDDDFSDNVTGMLIDLAERFGGEYDGWETQIVGGAGRLAR